MKCPLGQAGVSGVWSLGGSAALTGSEILENGVQIKEIGQGSESSWEDCPVSGSLSFFLVHSGLMKTILSHGPNHLKLSTKTNHLPFKFLLQVFWSQ